MYFSLMIQNGLPSTFNATTNREMKIMANRVRALVKNDIILVVFIQLLRSWYRRERESGCWRSPSASNSLKWI